MPDTEEKEDVKDFEEESSSSGEEEVPQTESEEETPEESEQEEKQEDKGDVNEALRQAREQLRNANSMIEFLKNTAGVRQGSNVPEKKRIEIDPEAPIIGKELISILDDREEQVLSRANANRLETLEMVARSHHPDYDRVALGYFKEMCAQNPGLYQSVMSTPNPPELAYKWGTLHPDFQKEEKKKAAISTAKKIVSNTKKVATLAESSGKKGTTKGTDKIDFMNMSDEEFDAHVAKVKAKAYK